MASVSPPPPLPTLAPLVECVANVSEGERADVLAHLAAAVRAVPDALLLDVHSDAAHQRSVFTFAGALAVGARPPLIAFNIPLRTADLAVARAVARAVRASSGGLSGVQALGLATTRPGIVQVSMNLIDLAATPLHVVVARVAAEAAQ